jgi:Caspase domain
MTNSWASNPQSGFAIAIGINQYQNFQPLSYAQHDALALRSFLVNEAGFAPDRFLLLTDTSPAIEQSSTYPDQHNIQGSVARLCQQLQPGDLLWFFFCGYGVRFEEQDYLMPIDGDPAQVQSTGVAIATLFSTFKAAATDHILVVLDMNRSQGTLAGQGVGENTAALARESGIPTILSAQPGQFSHETLALRQGLLTTALLEGLRYQGCLTPEHLAQYLSDRLPQLSEHHWRPRQEPLAIIPADQKYQLILPGKTLVGTGGSSRLPMPTPQQRSNPLPNPVPGQPSQGRSILPSGVPFGDTANPPAAWGNSSQALIPVAPSEPSQPTVEDDTFWRKLLLWGGAIALLLLLGVFLRNWADLARNPEPTPVPTATDQPVPDAVSPTLPAPVSPAPVSPAPVSPAPVSPAPTQPDAVVIAPQPTSPSQPDSTPQAIGQDTGEVPTDPNPITPPPTPAAPLNSGSSSALEDARAGLDRAIATVPSTQASAFNRAIEQARSVPPGDPLYAQAQRDIDRWSQAIVDLAQQRARQSNGGSTSRAVRNYRSAIAAAQLVPADRSSQYAQAQRLIGVWRQNIQDMGYSP